MHIDKRGTAVKNVQHPCPLSKGNISVADYIPLSSLLNTVKINGNIECTWCITNSDR